MGRLVLRGTRDNPKVYADYYDVDGTRRTRLLPGVRGKKEGKPLLAQIEARVAAGKPGMVVDEPPPPAAVTVGALMETWLAGLENRNAPLDRQRATAHLRPAWDGVPMDEAQQLPRVMRWLDSMRSTGNLSGQSMRHNFNLLSRFFAWAIERGHAVINPCRMVPNGKRPSGAPNKDGPWIRDDETFRKVFQALPLPVNLVFYIGNRSGLRPSEVLALRMEDLGYLNEGVIRVKGSAGDDGIGPLKEDKKAVGKSKWVPAAADAETVLGPWLARRKAEGAGPTDLVFVAIAVSDKPRRSEWTGLRREYVRDCWERAREACGVPMTLYEATRHSFVTRNLEAGVPLDEVSAAVGHSSPVVTKKHYDRFIRRSFSDAIRGVKKPAPRGRNGGT